MSSPSFRKIVTNRDENEYFVVCNERSENQWLNIELLCDGKDGGWEMKQLKKMVQRNDAVVTSRTVSKSPMVITVDGRHWFVGREAVIHRFGEEVEETVEESREEVGKREKT